MSAMTTHRKRQSPRFLLGRLLLTVVFISVALFATTKCLIREPELETPPPEDVELPPAETENDTENTLSAEELAAEEARRSHLERKEGFFTILLSGVDDGNGGSDTNILVAVDTVGKQIYGASIPRDTKARVGDDYHKINVAYNKGGTEMLRQSVSQLLGIPVDYTVEVDLRGFEALVNAIGGVEFYVPLDMDYQDPYQDLDIRVSKGLQLLDGETALKVVRFRHNNDGTGYGSEDLGRMNTQQNFLKAVAKKTLTLSNIDKIDDFVKIFYEYVETDLSLGNLAWFGTEAISIGVDNISFSTLPNEWKSPYIYLNPEETLAMVNQHLNPYKEDRVMEDLHIPS